ncbi:type I-E CRISPR-associated protein Cas5/CasD [Corynebacterium sanguinis]|uniref:type I-E CRISPR-associated protein Cas5/CasD n=1 Tax=Corynebacterium sanguinis TaxID=2594913 RepID=UPI0011A3008A|nr:type I-E CRISPR-associated protein Cas5/CasD [Corynebacterium sanguinis]MCT1414299.1 type I-E CRISPR-associated protein Cas5/CasD [Corynebacterium sanguinis]MCT1585309.1 type I-E CRISPR-associated protein Cas5/CasD [Corynebacterium sanguinis]MCT1665044.1 type I-E CRISPR-associated protein Cas5/CasD [Corynebacterium sanguinis]MCT2023275.1 type I-E CRISPR-associated protein Cas5/CasD [Corynebacterium sanguinis]MCT2046988.1 type I-E CRISPR-associated protein Cas5/CasD [Corynebacterium sanguini
MSAFSLLLLLKGPMQSWGDESRFKTRTTAATPTKSGIVGLLAAAQGRRRTDPVEDLAELTLAVRVDQSGSLLRDYQTAQPWLVDPTANASLVKRYFLSDAAFVAAVESPRRELLDVLAEALNAPAFPLFLGRRSCPVPPDLVLGVVESPAEEALSQHHTWHATTSHKKEREKRVKLPIYRDASPGEAGAVPRQDVPLSFDPRHRKYGWRNVILASYVEFDNELGRADDDFFSAVVSA